MHNLLMEMPPIYRPQGFLLKTAFDIPGGDVLLRHYLLAVIMSNRRPQAKIITAFLARDIDREVEDVEHELKLLADGGWLEIERAQHGRHEHVYANSTQKLRTLVMDLKAEENARIEAWKSRQ